METNRADDTTMKRSGGFLQYLKESESRPALLTEDLVKLKMQQWPKTSLWEILEFASFSPDYTDALRTGHLEYDITDDAEKKKIKDQMALIKEEFEGLLTNIKVAELDVQDPKDREKKYKKLHFSGDVIELAWLYLALFGTKPSEMKSEVIFIHSWNAKTEYPIIPENKLQDFLSRLTLNGDVSRLTRWVINTANRMRIKEKKTYEEVLAELIESKVGLYLKWFSSDLKKQMPVKSIDQVQSFADLKKMVEDAEKNVGSVEDLPKSDIDPSTIHPCAARRLKLFNEAKALGADLTNDDTWLMAVTKTFQQNSIFGRYKPKVIAGTNNIDPNCNKTDSEGITPEMARRRDDRSYAYVKDGIGFDNRATETRWCTTGAFGGDGRWNTTGKTTDYWNDYTNRGAHPLIVCLNLKTGKLFQFLDKNGSIHFLNENDSTDDEGQEALPNGSYVDGIAAKWKTFGKLVTMAKKTFYKTAYSKLLSEAAIDTRGYVHIQNRETLVMYLPILDRFAGVVISRKDAAGLFADLKIPKLPPVDMREVEAATLMFYGCDIPEVKLLNCKATLMDGMFAEAKINKVEGLDTSNAKSITNLFRNQESSKRVDQDSKTLSLVPFKLNLKNCVRANFAFAGSQVERVEIVQPTQLQYAAKMFCHCVQLKNIPDMRFPKIKNLRSLVLADNVRDDTRSKTTFNRDNSTEEDTSYFAAEQVFAGCPLVYDLPEFDQKMKELEEWCKFDEPTGNVDENGYLILQSKEEVRASLKFIRKYPGIRIDASSANSFFEGVTVYVKNINMKGVKDARCMFKNASIQALGKLENTEDLEDISYMFSGAQISRIPDIIAPSCMQAYKAFAVSESSGSCHPPKNLALNPACLSYTTNYGDRRTANDVMSEILFPGTKFSSTWPWQWTKLSEQVYGGFSNSLKKEEDGWLLIEVPEQMRIAAKSPKLLKEIPGIRFTKNGAYQAFKNIQVNDAEFPVLDLQQVEDASSMFENAVFKSVAGLINAQSIKVGTNMFKKANIADGLPEVEFPALVNAVQMFASCRLGKPLTPKTLKSFKNLQLANSMFQRSSNTVPPIMKSSDYDFRSLNDANSMFYQCGLENIEEFECKTLKNAVSMFSNNTSLKTVGLISLENANDASFLFYSSQNLKEVGEVLVPRAICTKSMFSYNNELQVIGSLDISSTRTGSVQEMFTDTPALRIICNPTWPSRLPNSRSRMFYKSGLGRIYGKDGDRLNAALVEVGAR